MKGSTNALSSTWQRRKSRSVTSSFPVVKLQPRLWSMQSHATCREPLGKKNRFCGTRFRIPEQRDNYSNIPITHDPQSSGDGRYPKFLFRVITTPSASGDIRLLSRRRRKTGRIYSIRIRGIYERNGYR